MDTPTGLAGSEGERHRGGTRCRRPRGSPNLTTTMQTVLFRKRELATTVWPRGTGRTWQQARGADGHQEAWIQIQERLIFHQHSSRSLPIMNPTSLHLHSSPPTSHRSTSPPALLLLPMFLRLRRCSCLREQAGGRAVRQRRPPLGAATDKSGPDHSQGVAAIPWIEMEGEIRWSIWATQFEKQCK